MSQSLIALIVCLKFNVKFKHTVHLLAWWRVSFCTRSFVLVYLLVIISSDLNFCGEAIFFLLQIMQYFVKMKRTRYRFTVFKFSTSFLMSTGCTWISGFESTTEKFLQRQRLIAAKKKKKNDSCWDLISCHRSWCVCVVWASVANCFVTLEKLFFDVQRRVLMKKV